MLHFAQCIVRRGTGWKLGNAAEDSVGESADSFTDALAGQCHAGRDSGVRRDAIENAQLVRSEPEHIEECRAERSEPARDEVRQHAVERLRVPQHTRGEFVRQPAVGIGEREERAVEGDIEGDAPAHR
jgi:hypothetical protein